MQRISSWVSRRVSLLFLCRITYRCSPFSSQLSLSSPSSRVFSSFGSPSLSECSSSWTPFSSLYRSSDASPVFFGPSALEKEKKEIHSACRSGRGGGERGSTGGSLFHPSPVRWFTAGVALRSRLSSPKGFRSPHPLSPHEKRMTKEAKWRRRVREQHQERRGRLEQGEQMDTWRATKSLRLEQRHASAVAWGLVGGNRHTPRNSPPTENTSCSFAQRRREDLSNARALLQENERRRVWLKKMRKR